jgi:superfamily II RNA helicase
VCAAAGRARSPAKSQAQRLSLEDDLRRMKRVLRRLGHTDEDNVIQLKGQTASQISTADELVVTELMFNGVFGDLSPPQIVALLSALMNTEKSSGGGGGGGKGGAKGDGGDPAQRLPEELRHPFNQLKVAAKRVADVAQESQLDVDPEEFVGKFSPDLMEITHAWTKGVSASFDGNEARGSFFVPAFAGRRTRWDVPRHCGHCVVEGASGLVVLGGNSNSTFSHSLEHLPHNKNKKQKAHNPT